MPGGASSDERGALPLSDGAAFAGGKPDGRPRAKPAAAARPDFAYSHRVDSGLPPLHATRKHDFGESAAFVANLTVGSAQKSATFEAHLQALPGRAYPSLAGYSVGTRGALPWATGVRTAISAQRDIARHDAQRDNVHIAGRKRTRRGASQRMRAGARADARAAEGGARGRAQAVRGSHAHRQGARRELTRRCASHRTVPFVRLASYGGFRAPRIVRWLSCASHRTVAFVRLRHCM